MKNDRRAIIAFGLGNGDEGKGSIVDYLSNKYQAQSIIRYHGGSQACHNTVTDAGIQHAFSQFGSGTISSQAVTHLSCNMAIDLVSLAAEAEELLKLGVADPLSRVFVDHRALIITPFHIMLNRMQELARGANRHGSCGKGVGLTLNDGRVYGMMALRAEDFFDQALLVHKLRYIWESKLDIAQQIASQHPNNQFIQEIFGHFQLADNIDYFLSRCSEAIGCIKPFQLPDTGSGVVVFEGAQGILLDQQIGYWPHVTKSMVHPVVAEELVSELLPDYQSYRLGIIRAYMTRHGHGPFVTEDEFLTSTLPDSNNSHNEWQGAFRVGWLDLVALRYSLESIGGVDGLAVTCLDRFVRGQKVNVCQAYQYDGQEEITDCFEVERLGCRKVITRIKTPKKCQMEDREKVTRVLQQCKPVNKLHIFEPDKYLEMIFKELKVQVALASFGPKNMDKIDKKEI